MSSDAAGPVSLVSGDVRRHNHTMILDHIARNGPAARSEIATATGLTRGAVTALAGGLLEAGVLRETGPEPVRGKGRPLTRLSLAADGIALLTIQLDADRAVAVVTTLDGTEIARFARHHGRPLGAPDAVLDVLAAVVADAMQAVGDSGRRLVDVTVVMFAPTGGEPPIVLADTDLEWGPVDVIAGLRDRLPALTAAERGLDGGIRLVADATVAALAEYRVLPQRGDMLYMKSNSGIGGAIVTGGGLLTGAHGFAGAFGHVPIDHDGAGCVCGQRGCLVTVAGPDVVLAKAGLGERLAQAGLGDALAELTARVHAGDERARTAWLDAALWVGRTLQILTLSLDPAVVVLGGYWAPLAGDVAVAFAANRPMLGELEMPTAPDIVPGVLGDDAAILGAQWAARDRILTDPLRLAV